MRTPYVLAPSVEIIRWTDGTWREARTAITWCRRCEQYEEWPSGCAEEGEVASPYSGECMDRLPTPGAFWTYARRKRG